MLRASPVHLQPVRDADKQRAEILYHIADRMDCPSLARCLKLCPVTKVSRHL